MNVLLKHLNYVIGVLAIILGGAVPVIAIIQAGTVRCSDALGFAILTGGVVLIVATHFIDKSNLNRKYLYFLVAFVLSHFIFVGAQYIVQSFYGLVGQFDKCTIFVG